MIMLYCNRSRIISQNFDQLLSLHFIHLNSTQENTAHRQTKVRNQRHDNGLKFITPVHGEWMQLDCSAQGAAKDLMPLFLVTTWGLASCLAKLVLELVPHLPTCRFAVLSKVGVYEIGQQRQKYIIWVLVSQCHINGYDCGLGGSPQNLVTPPC